MKTRLLILLIALLVGCEDTRQRGVRDMSDMLMWPEEMKHCKWLEIPYKHSSGKGKFVVYCPAHESTQISLGKFGEHIVISKPKGIK